MPRLALFVACLLVLAGCSAGLDRTAERDLDQAAQSLDGQLEAPGLLAATALLFHAQRDRYPATPFELLGSDEARETGLQRLGLSALTLTPEGDGVTVAYTLLPSPGDPSDRFGRVTIAETDTAGTYDVGLLLERIADPDLADRSLPLAREGSYRVVRARGSLCATVSEIRDRVAAGQAPGAPPLRDDRGYTVTFTDARGAASDLGDGYTVTVPR